MHCRSAAVSNAVSGETLRRCPRRSCTSSHGVVRTFQALASCIGSSFRGSTIGVEFFKCDLSVQQTRPTVPQRGVVYRPDGSPQSVPSTNRVMATFSTDRDDSNLEGSTQGRPDCRQGVVVEPDTAANLAGGRPLSKRGGILVGRLAGQSKARCFAA